jgi:hypothetical protein
MDILNLIPELIAHFAHGSVADKPCVMDNGIYATLFCDNLFDQFLGVLDLAWYLDTATSSTFNSTQGRLSAFTFAAVVDDYFSTVGR